MFYDFTQVESRSRARWEEAGCFSVAAEPAPESLLHLFRAVEYPYPRGVCPRDAGEEYGADALRVYFLLLGEGGANAPWSESTARGCRRFLERVDDLFCIARGTGSTPALEEPFRLAVRKTVTAYRKGKYGAAVSVLMGLIRDISALNRLTRDELVVFLKLLFPAAPHLCEDIYSRLGTGTLLAQALLPAEEEPSAEPSVPVQINGKTRGTVRLAAGCTPEEAAAAAQADGAIAPLLAGKTVARVVYVPGKILNFVVRTE